MRFKVDENLPVEIAARLREGGHHAATVKEQDMIGHIDSHLAEVCQQESRVLVTLDLDFADIRAYPPDRYHGLIVLRAIRQDKYHLMDVFEQIVPLLEREPLAKHLWVVDERSVRIRGADAEGEDR